MNYYHDIAFMFKEYQSLKRFGTEDVEGIELGTTHVFPKLDGSNASVWSGGAGSRRRQLSLDSDNAGFYEWVSQNEEIKTFFEAWPKLRLYGEWLVPHSLKTYTDEAWRRFYVFDVTDEDGAYLHYEEYSPLMEKFNLDYIPRICTVKNGSYEQFIKQLDHTGFMIKDGEGRGEGIVIKNYDFVNKYGRVTWAKIVTNEFKEKHAKVMGGHEVLGQKMVEEEIAEKYVTSSLVDKEYEKIKLDVGGWNSKLIIRLLNTVFYCVVDEEGWNYVKEHNCPTVNFKTLKALVFAKTKEQRPDLF